MRAPLLLVLPLLSLVACQTLKDVSIGYADAIAGSELPSGEGPVDRSLVDHFAGRHRS